MGKRARRKRKLAAKPEVSASPIEIDDSGSGSPPPDPPVSPRSELLAAARCSGSSARWLSALQRFEASQVEVHALKRRRTMHEEEVVIDGGRHESDIGL